MGELDRVPSRLRPAFHWVWTAMMAVAVLTAIGVAVVRSW
jgi:hypothetical protein